MSGYRKNKRQYLIPNKSLLFFDGLAEGEFVFWGEDEELMNGVLSAVAI